MNPQDKVTRRQFIGRGAAGAMAAGWAHRSAPGSSGGGASGENPWRYDVGHLRRVDPDKVGYRQEAVFEVGLSGARRLVFGSEGRLYVAVSRGVLILGPAGERAGLMELGEQARCVRVAADGRVWVGLRDHIRVVSPDGETLARWTPFAGKPFLTGLALSGEDVFVADSGNRVVYRCDREGRVQLRMGERNVERAIPGLVVPSPFLDVEVGEDGLVRVNNAGRHKVEAYTRDGDLELSWGRPGVAIESFCGCCNPVGLGLLPGGRVVTAEKGLPRVKVYAADGELETVVAAPDAFAPVGSDERATVSAETGSDGLDVAVESEGRVAVLDRVGGRIHLFRKRTA